jgi:hypothetical protein
MRELGAIAFDIFCNLQQQVGTLIIRERAHSVRSLQSRCNGAVHYARVAVRNLGDGRSIERQPHNIVCASIYPLAANVKGMPCNGLHADIPQNITI